MILHSNGYQSDWDSMIDHRLQTQEDLHDRPMKAQRAKALRTARAMFDFTSSNPK